MASHGSSGLKELLTSSPNQAPNPFSRIMLSSPFGVDLALKIKELPLQVSYRSSVPKSGASSSPPLSPLGDDQRAEKKLGKEIKEEGTDENEKSIAEARSSSLVSGKCFPTPISSLKKVRTGRAYRYVRFDEETQSYVTEGIKISQADVLKS